MIPMYEGPQTFRPKDAPRYVPAEITIICCWSACLVDILFIWWYFRNQNQRKAAFRRKPDYRKEENQEWLDLTDRWVYSYLTCIFWIRLMCSEGRIQSLFTLCSEKVIISSVFHNSKWTSHLEPCMYSLGMWFCQL